MPIRALRLVVALFGDSPPSSGNRPPRSRVRAISLVGAAAALLLAMVVPGAVAAVDPPPTLTTDKPFKLTAI